MISDLLDAGLLADGDEPIWERPRLGQTHRATVTDELLTDKPRFGVG
jgi:hypothetical protein